MTNAVFSSGNPKETEYLKDVDMDGRIKTNTW
jgi:hypothetical protein